MNDNLRPSQRIRWLKEPETPERELEKQKNREKYERRKHRQGKTTKHKESRPAKSHQDKRH